VVRVLVVSVAVMVPPPVAWTRLRSCGLRGTACSATRLGAPRTSRYPVCGRSAAWQQEPRDSSTDSMRHFVRYALSRTTSRWRPRSSIARGAAPAWRTACSRRQGACRARHSCRRRVLSTSPMRFTEPGRKLAGARRVRLRWSVAYDAIAARRHRRPDHRHRAEPAARRTYGGARQGAAVISKQLRDAPRRDAATRRPARTGCARRACCRRRSGSAGSC
jgi:hypothetical protein